MILKQPLTCIIGNKFIFFKINDNDEYLVHTGVQIIQIKNGFNAKHNIIITEDDVIPFIVIHNWCIKNAEERCNDIGKGYISEYIKNAYIHNEFDYDNIINNLINKYNIPPIFNSKEEACGYLITAISRKYSK